MNLYDKYHSNRKLEKRVISDNDFTHKPLLNMLIKVRNKHMNVLDLGCGTGTICFYLASKGHNAVGIDISKTAIDLANINSKRLGFDKKIKFLVSNFPNGRILGKYDLIICTELLEHIYDHNKALNKVHTLLKKNGRVIFSVPLESSFLYRHKLLNKFENDVGHLRRYSGSKFINLIKDNEFKILVAKKNQGLIRDYLFTTTSRSLLVAIANRFKFFSDLLTFLDERLFFLGVSNMIVLAKRT